MTTDNRISTEFPLTPGATGAQELVTLWSVHHPGTVHYEAIAVRSHISSTDGTGLEADTMDPVTILKGVGDGTHLAFFHEQALMQLQELKATDYRVADLFAPQDEWP
ncbi:hypothetical protein ACQCSX_21905 (plasmid) [Pseudarthrobacter sp. P1]|uniref:hypothetical protein n=1 Tax=Pseudarthrobacter sp. P1 TaxID=3418418 RepID=UPI003CF68FB2